MEWSRPTAATTTPAVPAAASTAPARRPRRRRLGAAACGRQHHARPLAWPWRPPPARQRNAVTPVTIASTLRLTIDLNGGRITDSQLLKYTRSRKKSLLPERYLLDVAGDLPLTRSV
jgi:hypothetical protein